MHPALKQFVFSITLPIGLLYVVGCERAKHATLEEEQSLRDRRALSAEESYRKLSDAFVWERHVSNDFLPEPNRAANPTEASPQQPLQKIRVSLPWLPNDQIPALWVALNRNYFESEGLDVEIVPGGPGRDGLILLLGGQIDIAMASSATVVIRMIASETGGDLVAIGALQKEYPYAYVAIDHTIPTTEISNRVLTPEDFRGKSFGLTPGSDFLLSFALEKMGLEREEVVVRKAGNSLAPLTNGVFDYYSTMADNNPRKLEALGYQNWMLWEFSKHGWVDYHNVVTVLPDFLETKPHIAQAFLRALDRGVRDILAAEPAEIAQEILPYVVETGLTVPLITQRLEFQRLITVARPDEPILHMTTQRWIEAASILWKHGAIELPSDRSSL